MPRFRKKPVEIEARQVLGSESGHAGLDLATWCGGHVGGSYSQPYIVIVTLEGNMRANVGDWIIKGIQGEFYPCKPDIFAETYEEASSGAQADD